MQKRSKRLCLALAVLLSVSMVLVALAPAVEAASYKKGSNGAMVTQIQTKLKSWGCLRAVAVIPAIPAAPVVHPARRSICSRA